MTDDDKELCESLRARDHGDCTDAAARIEALTAERDAAVAQMQAALAERNKAEEWLKMAKSNTAEYERVVMAMGERRATAAIVADLRKAPSCHEIEHDLAARYERGDHLTEAKP